MKFTKFVVIMVLLSSQVSFAWGRRGHALICESASYVMAKNLPLIKGHSFDMGYYCNVPDFLWRRKATNDIERDEHYVDLEIFERVLGKNGEWNPDRVAFLKKYPEAEKGGMAFWRISEICKNLEGLQKDLNGSKLTKEDRSAKQARWLSTAGALGHYIGDLSQPLHTSENHDGQLSDQKGIHAYYETELIDELYPDITKEVFDSAQRQFESLKDKSKLSCFEIARELADTSHKDLPELLDIDKKLSRKDLVKAKDAHRKAIVNQMARGSAYVALTLSKYSSWPAVEQGFFDFEESPKYISPAK